MIRIGVDFGGTKIEAAALDADDCFVARVRKPNPGTYEAALETVCDLVADVEAKAGVRSPVIGVGMPGSLSPATGLVRNANSTWLNGKPFDRDLETILGRPVRLENDANCFALSEAMPEHADSVVFGVILGTGVGAGLVVGGRLVHGRNGIAGEWGHSPLPWPDAGENGAHRCWCGAPDCLETWLSGPAFEAQYAETGNPRRDAAGIVAAANAGEEAASRVLDRYVDRLARALATVCNLIDPDVIVLGGGLSNISALYGPKMMSTLCERVFSDAFETVIRPPRHGDSSGVRGAAWLAAS